MRVLNPPGLLNQQWLWAVSSVQPRMTPSPSEVKDGSASGSSSCFWSLNPYTDVYFVSLLIDDSL